MDEQLMKFFDFDEAELQANRNNGLSEKQKVRLEKEDRSQKGCSVFGGIFLFALGLAGIGLLLYYGLPTDSNARTALLIMFGGIWPLVWCALGFMFLRRASAKMKVAVKTVQGPVNIVKTIKKSYNSSTKTHSEYPVYELHVGGRTFKVDSSLADIIMQGDVYAVYYADINLEDREDPILSVELLEKAK
jgi:hypothetical protein